MLIHLGYSLFHFVKLVALVSKCCLDSISWHNSTEIEFQHELTEASIWVLRVWLDDPATDWCFSAHNSSLYRELVVEIVVGTNDYKGDAIRSLKGE